VHSPIDFSLIFDTWSNQEDADQPGCIRGHNWTAYRPGTQFGYSGLGTAMHACERATPMTNTHLRCTSCETRPYKMHACEKCMPIYMPARDACLSSRHTSLRHKSLPGIHLTSVILIGMVCGRHASHRHTSLAGIYFSQARTRIVSPADKPSNCVPDTSRRRTTNLDVVFQGIETRLHLAFDWSASHLCSLTLDRKLLLMLWRPLGT
jgi:hypothetical protein